MPTPKKKQGKSLRSYPLQIIRKVSHIENRQAMLLQEMRIFLKKSPDNNVGLCQFKNAYRALEGEKMALLRRL